MGKHDVTVNKHFIAVVEQAVIIMQNTAMFMKSDIPTPETLAKWANRLDDQASAVELGLEYID
jgi:hypothetical protein